MFVVPEYNYFMPPALLNAIDYLFFEWSYKPVGFVSYGGVSGGLRSVQSAKPLVTTLKMMPIPESVVLPMAMKLVENGVFQGAQPHVDSAKVMLDELLRWTNALKTLRG